MAPDKAPGAGNGRLARGSLSEEEILSGAKAIVERDGLDGLSMPKLAAKLGSGVMSIYSYFRNKDELIAAMADRAGVEVFSGLSRPGDGPADEEVQCTYRALHRQLRRLPTYLRLCRADPQLLQPRAAVAPALARWLFGELAVLQRLGVDGAGAMRLHGVLMPYTVGFALMQDDEGPDQGGASPEERFAESLRRLDPQAVPTIRSASDPAALVALDDRTFEDGLELFIAGIQSRGA
jgi:AcrR family transcriptional regulator